MQKVRPHPLHYCIDCTLAAFFSIICAEYLIDFIFSTLNIIQKVNPVNDSLVVISPEDIHKRIIFGAVVIGACYETILKKALNKKNQFDKENE